VSTRQSRRGAPAAGRLLRRPRHHQTAAASKGRSHLFCCPDRLWRVQRPTQASSSTSAAARAPALGSAHTPRGSDRSSSTPRGRPAPRSPSTQELRGMTTHDFSARTTLFAAAPARIGHPNSRLTAPFGHPRSMTGSTALPLGRRSSRSEPYRDWPYWGPTPPRTGLPGPTRHSGWPQRSHLY
jgi:hypothetical protein